MMTQNTVPEVERFIADWFQSTRNSENVSTMIAQVVVAVQQFRDYGTQPNTGNWHDNQCILYSMLTSVSTRTEVPPCECFSPVIKCTECCNRGVCRVLVTSCGSIDGVEREKHSCGKCPFSLYCLSMGFTRRVKRD